MAKEATKYQKLNVKKIVKWFEGGHNRYLLADEVGLGKTVTAEGVIKEICDKKENKEITVGYICSNMALAAQNVSEMRRDLSSEGYSVDYKRSERLALTCMKSYESGKQQSNQKGKVKLTILTPNTSLKVISKGTKDERIAAFILMCGGCDEAKAGVNGNDPLWIAEKRIATTTGSEVNENDLNIKSLCGLSQESITELVCRFKDKIQEDIERNIEDGHIAGFCKRNLEPYLKRGIAYFLNKICSGKKDVELYKRKENLKKYCVNNKVNSDDGKQTPKDMERFVSDNAQSYIEDCKKNSSKVNTEKWIDSLYKQYKATPEYEVYINKKRDEVSTYLKSLLSDKTQSPSTDSQELLISYCQYELIPMARKMIIAIGLDMMQCDLFIADEIQNYSEIFFQANETENDSEYSYVMKRILNQNSKLLMLSATPFRVHSRYNAFRNDLADDEDADKEVGCENSAPTDIVDTCSEMDYLCKQTDIQNEFYGILNLVSENGFKREEWETCIGKKKEVFSQSKAKEDKLKEFKSIISEQNKILQNSGLSRVERYLAGTMLLSDQKDDSCLTWEDITLEELLSFKMDSNREIVNDDKRLLELLKKSENELYVVTNEDSLYLVSLKCFSTQIMDWNYFFQYYDYDEYNEEGEEQLFVVWSDGEQVLFEKWDRSEEEKKEILRNCYGRIGTEHHIRKDYLKCVPAIRSFSAGLKEFNKINEGIRSHEIQASDKEKGISLISMSGKTEQGSSKILDARFRKLCHQLFDVEKSHLLLFIPPSSPQSKLEGIFEDKRGFSKRLFFSDYCAVPRSLSVLLSYEAKRRVRVELENKTNAEVKYKDLEGNERTVNLLEGDIADDKKSGIRGYIRHKIEERNFEGFIPDDLRIRDDSRTGLYFYQKQSFENVIISLFTSKEALQILKICHPEKDDVFDLLSSYCSDGDFLSVLDEYRFLINDDETFKIIMGFSNSTQDFKRTPKNLIKTSFSKIKVKVTTENGVESDMEMETDFAIGHYSNAVRDQSSADTIAAKIAAFNSPFRPFCFITTSIGQEGLNFHQYCRKIVHWSLATNPVQFEQREGRINRRHCYAIRLLVADKYWSDKGKPTEFDFNWKKAFEYFRTDEKYQSIYKESLGLFPDFVFDINKGRNADFGIRRETYYYPMSFESKYFTEVLKAVGYYRSLLGQSADETLEEKTAEIMDGLDIKERVQCFINLSPRK